ncbi:non-ltr retroelement reverse transcriptase, partial [Striga asiatica]
QVGEHQHLHHPEEHEIPNLAIVCREEEKKDLQETHYIEAITMETDVVEELGETNHGKQQVNEVPLLRAKPGSSWKRRASADGRLLRVEEVQMEVVNTVGRGLLVMWDSEVEVKVVVGNEFCIQMELRGKGMVEWCWMIFVYMSTDKNTRSRQWEYLESCKSQWGPCWVIAGDWNDISSNHEKRGGIPRSAASFIPFNQFIFRMKMCEVDQKGSFFTWGNNRSSGDYIEERLDKVFVSSSGWPDFQIWRTASDHNVILFDTEKDAFKHHRRFQFNSHWLKLEGIQEAVEAGWQGIVEGTAMYQVHQKLKNTRMALLAWHKPIHRNSATTIKELTTKMEDMRMEVGSNPDKSHFFRGCFLDYADKISESSKGRPVELFISGERKIFCEKSL